MLGAFQAGVTCSKVQNEGNNSMYFGEGRGLVQTDWQASECQVVVSQKLLKLTITYGNNIIPIFQKKRGWKQLQHIRARIQVQVRP